MIQTFPVSSISSSGSALLSLFLLPLVFAFLTTPLAIKLAIRLGIVDRPDHRKVHRGEIPRLGGVAIFSSFMISIVAALVFLEPSSLPPDFFPLAGGGALIFALGLLDDIFGLRPRIKFAWQFLVAIGLVSSGLVFDTITNPFGLEPFQLGWIAYPLTVMWIVGIINAINLSDGLDGLAAGMSVIVLGTMAGIAFLNGNEAVLLGALPLMGATLGFLRYNFNPARIFMGDSGSLFLGYMLAVLSIRGSMATTTTITILVPLVALGLPIFDTLFSMMRRLAVKKKMFEADKDHVHHKLLSMGFDQKQTVMILYLISISFCALAFMMTAAQNRDLAGFFLLYLVGIYLLIRRLGYLDLIFRHRNEHRKRVNKVVYGRNFRSANLPSRIFRRLTDSRASLFLLDLISFSFCYILALYLWGFSNPFYEMSTHSTLLAHLGFSLVILSTSFLAGGCHNDVWRYIEFNGFGRYFKSLTFAMLVIYFFSDHLFPNDGLDLRFFTTYWIILLLATLFLRLSHNFYYNFVKRQISSRKNGERVLIYGAGDSGEILQGLLTKHDDFNYQLLGYIDDNPAKLGRKIYRLSVLGQTKDIPEICKEYSIDRILLSTTKHSKQKEQQLRKMACGNGVKVSTIEFDLLDRCDVIKNSEKQG